MPFKSEVQRRWMHANKPKMADRWEDHTPAGSKLPKKKTADMDKIAKRKKPYRNRVDVFALDKKNRLYSGLYPDGSIGPFGGGVDRGETVLQAAVREFEEEAGRKITNPKRLSIPNFEESVLARKGWMAAGKHDRAKRYGGTRSYTVVADLVPGKKLPLTEPADHINKVKFRTLDEAIKAQKKAVEGAPKGRKGILKHRLKALKNVAALREKTASEIADTVWHKLSNDMDSPVAPTVAGGILGGIAAHNIFPTKATVALRELAAKLPQGKPQRHLLDKALRSNANRLFRGAGLGLLGGYATHKLLESPR